LTGGSVVSGSLRVTVAGTAGLVVGMSVTGSSNIPTGTTVRSITNGTTIQLSAAATATASGLTLTASGQFPQTPVTAIAAGQRHVLAISGGKVYGWGYNLNGQLGDTTQIDRATPVLTLGTGALSGRTVTAVAAGLNHSLALDSTGTLYAWGGGSNGQLGNGTTTLSQTSPVAITGGSLAGRVVTAAAAAGNRSYAIAGGSLYGWGDNAAGILGNGGTVNASSPVLLNGGSLAGKTVTHVAAGYNHTVARTSDGLLFAWGANDRGQLGTGNLTSSQVPVAVKMTGALAGKTVTKVYAGAASTATIVLASDNKLYTWGGRGLGQLGNGSWGVTLEPVQVSATGTFVSAAAGDGFSVSAASDNFVNTWGAGELGQLGNGMDGLRPSRSGADSMSLSGRKLVSIVAGHASVTNSLAYDLNQPFHIALATDGTAYGWGRNDRGQIAQGTMSASSVPLPITAGTLLSAISAGGSHVLAVGRDGRAYAWGGGSGGQLGTGGTLNAAAPVAVTGGSLAGGTVMAVAAGWASSLAVTTEGKVYSWGQNATGQLGTGGTISTFVPAAVVSTGALAGKYIVAVAATNSSSGGTSYALSGDGLVYAWGNGSLGQLGNGSLANSNVPVAVNTAGVLSGRKIVALATGVDHVLALSSDNLVFAWGQGGFGQQGNASVANNSAPVQVGGLSGSVVAIAAQGNSSYALTSDGRIFGWGQGERGQVGDGLNANRSTPVLLSYTDGTVSQLVNIAALGNAAMAWDNGGMELLLQPKGTTVAMGSPFSLSCAVNLQGIAVNYQWWQEVTQADGSKRWLPVAGGSQPLLSVPSADASSLGRYYVRVDSHLDSVTSNIVTVAGVEEVPVFSVGSLPAINVTTGATVTLSVPATPMGTYQWKKDGVAITGANGLTYSIGAADASSAGSYTLTVTNGLGSATSPAQVLSVAGSPGYVAWGTKQFGLIGNGSGLTGSMVVTTGALAGKTVVELAAGLGHFLARTSDGLVYAWGYNINGQLGNNSLVTATTPVAVDMTGVLAGKTVTAVACGLDASYVLTSDGKIFAWGGNANGQLGNNSLVTATTPVAVDMTGVLAGKTVAAISASGFHCVARTTDGQLFAWGLNDFGQLGNNSRNQANAPVAVNMSGALAGKTIVAACAARQYLGAAGSHTVALASDGKLYAWGVNAYGQLGNGTTTMALLPTEVDMTGVLAGKTITKLFSDDTSTMVLTSDNQVYTWGWNAYGQLGNGTTNTAFTPVAVDLSPLGGKTVADFAGGAGYYLFRTTDNSYFASGYNAQGQMGTGFYDSCSVLTPVVLPAGKTFVSATAARYASAFLTNTGEIYTIGDFSFSALGWGPGGQVAWAEPTPINVDKSYFGGKTLVQITGGRMHAIGLTEDGEVYSWGIQNASGQLGKGNLVPSTTPASISNSGALAGKTIVAVASGFFHNIALTSEGQLITWGDNSAGQLGVGSTVTSTVPLLVAATPDMVGKRFCSVAAAGSVSMALTTDGKVFVWGKGSAGCMGNGSTNSSTVPLLVSALSAQTITAIAATTTTGSDESAYALTAAGEIYSWGYNAQGQLGNSSTTIQFNSPGLVGGIFALKKATALSASNAAVFATAEDGQLYAWGWNTAGQLANGNSNTALTPTMVLGLSGKVVQAFIAGGNGAAALTSDGQVYGWGYNLLGMVGDGTTATKTLPVLITSSGALAGRRITGFGYAGPGVNTSATAGLAGSQGTFYAMDAARVNFTAQPRSASAVEGSTLTLNAGVHAPGISVRYQWKKQTIVSGTLSWVSVPGEESTQFTIPSVTALTAGTFALEAVTPAGSVLSAPAVVGLLTALPAFDLAASPAPVNINLGGTLSLSMALTAGTAPMTYQWRKDGVPISGATQATYTLANAGATASGRYTLTATNGLGSATSAVIPVQVGPVNNGTVGSGSLIAWGFNLHGQVGDGKGLGKTEFSAVDKSGVLAGKTITALAVGQSHSLALTSDGKVYAWGYGIQGQLGHGSNPTYQPTPVAVNMTGVLAGKTVTAIAAGNTHSLALTSDGRVFAWGGGARPTTDILGNNATAEFEPACGRGRTRVCSWARPSPRLRLSANTAWRSPPTGRSTAGATTCSASWATIPTPTGLFPWPWT
jgi:alpha-tubulin suppressor-like RCC1 family protein